MRLVLDSSVIIAAHISRAGVCAQLFEDVLMQHELVLSDYILDEVTGKLRKKFAVPAPAARRVHRLLVAASERVVPAEVPRDACRDPADLPVLGTAVAGQAALLVTVDRDLLEAGPWRGVEIVRPGGFWALTRR